jgi:hypothetical protein
MSASERAATCGEHRVTPNRKDFAEAGLKLAFTLTAVIAERAQHLPHNLASALKRLDVLLGLLKFFLGLLQVRASCNREAGQKFYCKHEGT